MKHSYACHLIGLLYTINRIGSNHIHIWRRNEKYDDKIFVNQFNITEEPLQVISATSCGRLCIDLRKSSAFSFRKKHCYCYESKPTDVRSYANLKGAEFYSIEPVAKTMVCVDKKYTYLGYVDLCFKIYNDFSGFLNSAHRCRSDGAHLIMLDTVEKLQAFQFLPPNTYYVIGLEKKSGKWEWTDERSVVFNTSLWYKGEPNGASFPIPELCGGVGYSRVHGTMPGIVDIGCMHQLFICEIYV